MTDHIEWVAVRAAEIPEVYAKGVWVGGASEPTDDEVNLRLGFGDGGMVCGTKADVEGWLTNALSVLQTPERWIQPDPEEVCSEEGCTNTLTDNEGYDGLCGTHADQAEKEGKWS